MSEKGFDGIFESNRRYLSFTALALLLFAILACNGVEATQPTMPIGFASATVTPTEVVSANEEMDLDELVPGYHEPEYGLTKSFEVGTIRSGEGLLQTLVRLGPEYYRQLPEERKYEGVNEFGVNVEQWLQVPWSVGVDMHYPNDLEVRVVFGDGAAAVRGSSFLSEIGIRVDSQDKVLIGHEDDRVAVERIVKPGVVFMTPERASGGSGESNYYYTMMGIEGKQGLITIPLRIKEGKGNKWEAQLSSGKWKPIGDELRDKIMAGESIKQALEEVRQEFQQRGQQRERSRRAMEQMKNFHQANIVRSRRQWRRGGAKI